MGRRRWNKKHPDKARAQQQRRPEDAGDPPVRLLALQPGSNVVAVAIGTRVNLVNYETGAELKLATPQASSATGTTPAEPSGPHAGSLRVLQFSPDGRCLLTGGDDKSARLWLAPAASAPAPADTAAPALAPAADTPAWRCVAAWKTPKKMSAGGFSLDGSCALFADKFGDVLVGRVPEGEGEGVAAAVEPPLRAPATLLGHFCSIVTGVLPSPCGRFLATSDKDYKVRVSAIPEDLTQGSFEIQSYCMGHQDFVSCIAFALQPPQHGGAAFLLSGSGDGTVRMWDIVTGQQLASYVASAPLTPTAAPAGAAEAEAAGPAAVGEGGTAEFTGVGAEEGGGEASGGGDEGDDEGDGAAGDEEPSVAGAADGEVDADGEGEAGEPQRRSKAPPCAPVLSLAVSHDGSTVAVVVEGNDEVQLLSIDWASRGLALKQRLCWSDVRYPCQATFGPAGHLWAVGGAPLPTARSIHIGVARRGPDGQYVTCTEKVLSAPVRALLEARVEEEEAKMAEGGELFVYSKHLRKPTYDEEEIESRKRKRSDHKETQRLAALRQRQDEEAKATAAGAAANADVCGARAGADGAISQ